MASTTTPFGKQGNCGDDNHGTSQPSQLSVLTGNVQEERLVNSTRRPLRDITNIEPAGGKENQAVEMHGNKGIKRQKKGIFGEGNHGTCQPSQLSGLTGNIREARLVNSTKRPLHDITNIEDSDNIDGHPRIGATIDVCASNIDGDEDESWLHRNDNWHPSTVILRRHGGNLDGGVGQSVTPEELQKAKRREYKKEYRQRKKEELAIARQIQNVYHKEFYDFSAQPKKPVYNPNCSIPVPCKRKTVH
ncbi:hypothetical protein EJB05_45188 [Eragrostis curvula]|uniref:Uncharacterized protein n=1 Tax=Eragrostis curvula TaxID=38414 RepID=A0A5J9TJY0_9POAL|nr:hypothetical protein EJB05_45188 [Eragrostis curvula]